MPNNLTLAKNYTALLDEVYKTSSVTSDLTDDASMTRAGTNVNEICYPQIAVTGLGDYDRNSGYTDGSVNLEWKTTKFNYDRGTKISVDVMDDEETFNISFGQAGAELIRTKVAPEADAFTFATLAGITGISKATAATYSSANDFLAALLEAKNKMDEDEVPEEGRILYATPTLLNGIMALDTTKSKAVLSKYSTIIEVPRTRMYTAIELYDGTTNYGFKKVQGKYVKTEDTEIVSGKDYYTESDGTYTKVASPAKSGLATYYEITGVGKRNETLKEALNRLADIRKKIPVRKKSL